MIKYIELDDNSVIKNTGDYLDVDLSSDVNVLETFLDKNNYFWKDLDNTFLFKIIDKQNITITTKLDNIDENWLLKLSEDGIDYYYKYSGVKMLNDNDEETITYIHSFILLEYYTHFYYRLRGLIENKTKTKFINKFVNRLEVDNVGWWYPNFRKAHTLLLPVFDNRKDDVIIEQSNIFNNDFSIGFVGLNGGWKVDVEKIKDNPLVFVLDSKYKINDASIQYTFENHGEVIMRPVQQTIYGCRLEPTINVNDDAKINGNFSVDIYIENGCTFDFLNFYENEQYRLSMLTVASATSLTWLLGGASVFLSFLTFGMLRSTSLWNFPFETTGKYNIVSVYGGAGAFTIPIIGLAVEIKEKNKYWNLSSTPLSLDSKKIINLTNATLNKRLKVGHKEGNYDNTARYFNYVNLNNDVKDVSSKEYDSWYDWGGYYKVAKFSTKFFRNIAGMNEPNPYSDEPVFFGTNEVPRNIYCLIYLPKDLAKSGGALQTFEQWLYNHWNLAPSNFTYLSLQKTNIPPSFAIKGINEKFDNITAINRGLPKDYNNNGDNKPLYKNRYTVCNIAKDISDPMAKYLNAIFFNNETIEQIKYDDNNSFYFKLKELLHNFNDIKYDNLGKIINTPPLITIENEPLFLGPTCYWFKYLNQNGKIGADTLDFSNNDEYNIVSKLEVFFANNSIIHKITPDKQFLNKNFDFSNSGLYFFNTNKLLPQEYNAYSNYLDTQFANEMRENMNKNTLLELQARTETINNISNYVKTSATLANSFEQNNITNQQNILQNQGRSLTNEAISIAASQSIMKQNIALSRGVETAAGMIKSDLAYQTQQLKTQQELDNRAYKNYQIMNTPNTITIPNDASALFFDIFPFSNVITQIDKNTQEQALSYIKQFAYKINDEYTFDSYSNRNLFNYFMIDTKINQVNLIQDSKKYFSNFPYFNNDIGDRTFLNFLNNGVRLHKDLLIQNIQSPYNYEIDMLNDVWIKWETNNYFAIEEPKLTISFVKNFDFYAPFEVNENSFNVNVLETSWKIKNDLEPIKNFQWKIIKIVNNDLINYQVQVKIDLNDLYFVNKRVYGDVWLQLSLSNLSDGVNVLDVSKDVMKITIQSLPDLPNPSSATINVYPSDIFGSIENHDNVIHVGDNFELFGEVNFNIVNSDWDEESVLNITGDIYGLNIVKTNKDFSISGNYEKNGKYEINANWISEHFGFNVNKKITVYVHKNINDFIKNNILGLINNDDINKITDKAFILNILKQKNNIPDNFTIDDFNLTSLPNKQIKISGKLNKYFCEENILYYASGDVKTTNWKEINKTYDIWYGTTQNNSSIVYVNSDKINYYYAGRLRYKASYTNIVFNAWGIMNLETIINEYLTILINNNDEQININNYISGEVENMGTNAIVILMCEKTGGYVYKTFDNLPINDISFIHNNNNIVSIKPTFNFSCTHDFGSYSYNFFSSELKVNVKYRYRYKYYDYSNIDLPKIDLSSIIKVDELGILKNNTDDDLIDLINLKNNSKLTNKDLIIVFEKNKANITGLIEYTGSIDVSFILKKDINIDVPINYINNLEVGTNLTDYIFDNFPDFDGEVLEVSPNEIILTGDIYSNVKNVLITYKIHVSEIIDNVEIGDISFDDFINNFVEKIREKNQKITDDDLQYLQINYDDKKITGFDKYYGELQLIVNVIYGNFDNLTNDDLGKMLNWQPASLLEKVNEINAVNLFGKKLYLLEQIDFENIPNDLFAIVELKILSDTTFEITGLFNFLGSVKQFTYAKYVKRWVKYSKTVFIKKIIDYQTTTPENYSLNILNLNDFPTGEINAPVFKLVGPTTIIAGNTGDLTNIITINNRLIGIEIFPTSGNYKGSLPSDLYTSIYQSPSEHAANVIKDGNYIKMTGNIAYENWGGSFLKTVYYSGSGNPNLKSPIEENYNYYFYFTFKYEYEVLE